jgi:di/tricarboxylate transporter
METWPEYLKNSIGLKIFLGVCFLLLINIMIAKIIERKRIEGETPEEDKKIQSIKTIKMLWIGMLAGFVVSVVIVVTQFIARFGYFTLLQEIGAVTVGIAGAVVGGLCGIIKWRKHNQVATHRR